MRTRDPLTKWLATCGLFGIVFMCAAAVRLYAATLPPGQEPQVLIILDTSQGMAGTLQGAIMSGSGTVPDNANSASPPCYTVNGYTPRSSAGPSNGGSCPAGTAPYTVLSGGVLTDNSESMINVAEQSLIAAFNNPNYHNIFQAGLLDYATSGTPQPYNTWVYYMSSDAPTGSGARSAPAFAACSAGVFGYGSGSSSSCAVDDALAVPNPCDQPQTGSGCSSIGNLLGSGLATSPYLYIDQTSDDPQINDVLYDFASGSAPPNFVSYDGPSPSNPYTAYTLNGYETQITATSPLLEGYNCLTGSGCRSGFATSPTDAGYIPYSGMVWYAERGLAFDGNPVTNGTHGGQGDLLVPVAPLATSLAQFDTAMAPEQFVAGGNEIVAGSEYAPMAGALTAALTDLTTASNAPTPACAPKYVILITDGQPTMGLHGQVYPPLGSAAALGYGEVLSPGNPNNDNAATEAITAVQNLANYSANGVSGIKTYVLGVGPGVDCPPSATGCTAEAQAGYQVLSDLATAGQTQTVYSADSAASFQSAFNAILNNIENQVVTASTGSSSQVTTTAFQYVAKSTAALGEGDLFAYAVTPAGNSQTPSWDANGLMASSNSRPGALYSDGPPTATGAPGPITLFTSMDSAAFALPAGSTLTPSIVEQYTINPSYAGGVYLGGRNSGWYVGVTTASKPAYMGPPNNPQLLANSTYVSYAQSESARPPLVLFPDNDGFVYAVNASTGALAWGWMPREFVASLQNYQTFWQNPNMAGDIRTVSAKDSTGTWQTYVVGTAQQGGIQYALELTSSGGLNSEAWEEDNPNALAPNPVIPMVFRMVSSSGTAYLGTVLNTTTGTTTASTLVVTDIGTGVVTNFSLPFTANTQPYLDQANNVFIGDNAGTVWTNTFTLSASGALTLGSTWIPLNNSAPSPVGSNFGSSTTTSGGTGAITNVGGVYLNGVEYLRLQSSGRLTVLVDGATSWAPLWTSYIGGSASYSASGGGYVTSTAVTALPTDTTITNPATILNGAITLPVSVSSTSSSACAAPSAAYYYYSVTDGAFPVGVFAGITQGMIIGTGAALTPSIAIMDGQFRIQPTSTNEQYPPPPYSGAGPPPAGPASWRELFNEIF